MQALVNILKTHVFKYWICFLITFPIYSIFTRIWKKITPKLDFMLPWCSVISRWAVNFSKQNLLYFSLIKRKNTTMQNRFWLVGAESRFQEIKQTISFGNSPKHGVFWPQSRGGQPLPEVGHLIFPKDCDPGLGRGGVRQSAHGRPGSSRPELCGIFFPTGSLG